jgi:hypothetical protein
MPSPSEYFILLLLILFVYGSEYNTLTIIDWNYFLFYVIYDIIFIALGKNNYEIKEL